MDKPITEQSSQFRDTLITNLPTKSNHSVLYRRSARLSGIKVRITGKAYNVYGERIKSMAALHSIKKLSDAQKRKFDQAILEVLKKFSISFE